MLSRLLICIATGFMLLRAVPVDAYDGLLRLPPPPSSQVSEMNRNPAMASERRIYITYGGNIVLRFPSYSFRVINYRDGAIPYEGTTGIVFDNGAGTYWDGRGLFVNPNYAAHLLTANRYARGIVGDPSTQLPWFTAETAYEPMRVAPEFPLIVGYRSLADAVADGYVGPDHGPAQQLEQAPLLFTWPEKATLESEPLFKYWGE